MNKRKDNRWQLSETIEISGIKKRYTFYGTTKAEAQEKRDKFIRSNNSDAIKFKDAYDEYKRLEEVRITKSAYKTKCERIEFFADIFPCRLTEITPKQISTIINRLAVSNPHTNKPTAKRTLTRYLAAVSNVFEFAMANRLTTYNPCKYVKIPSVAQTASREALSEDEYNTILDSTEDCCFAAKLMILTGMRRGEAAALTYDDIDIDNNIIHITKSYDYKNKKIKPPKSISGIRDIPIPNRLKMLLNGKKSANKGTYYVVNDSNNVMSESEWQYLVKEIINVTGIKFTLHQLRHTYASILYSANVDVLTSQKWLGHSDVKVTLGIYTHLSETKKKISSEKLDAYIG